MHTHAQFEHPSVPEQLNGPLVTIMILPALEFGSQSQPPRGVLGWWAGDGFGAKSVDWDIHTLFELKYALGCNIRWFTLFALYALLSLWTLRPLRSCCSRRSYSAPLLLHLPFPLEGPALQSLCFLHRSSLVPAHSRLLMDRLLLEGL